MIRTLLRYAFGIAAEIIIFILFATLLWVFTNIDAVEVFAVSAIASLIISMFILLKLCETGDIRNGDE